MVSDYCTVDSWADWYKIIGELLDETSLMITSLISKFKQEYIKRDYK